MDCVAPPSKGGDAIHQCPLDAVALCILLTCALLMTSSHSEGPPVGFVANLTAVGIDRNGNRVARHELLNSSKPVSKMDLYVDVPSKATGTGEALYMDGQDIVHCNDPGAIRRRGRSSSLQR